MEKNGSTSIIVGAIYSGKEVFQLSLLQDENLFSVENSDYIP